MSETTFADYTGPAELRTRGTILVVPGRGESEATYRRLACGWRPTPTGCGCCPLRWSPRMTWTAHWSGSPRN